MMTKIIGLMGLMGLMVGAVAQTANTNDVATSWNVQFNYSTNQRTALIWVYRNYTNGITLTVTNQVGTNVVITTNAIPVLADWHRDLVRGAAGRMADDYVRQRAEAINAQPDEVRIRQALPDATDAQIQQIKEILGL